MKATQLLKKDHQAVKHLLAEFSRATSRAPRRRQKLMDDIAEELDIHSTIEEEIFYPEVKGVRGGEALITEAEAEHKEIDALVAEAQGMAMTSAEVTAKARELRDAVIHHATEEERRIFPFAERHLAATLTELGNRLAARKKELARSRIHRATRAVKKVIRKVA
jgi:hemerythrin superfamily protein